MVLAARPVREAPLRPWRCGFVLATKVHACPAAIPGVFGLSPPRFMLSGPVRFELRQQPWQLREDAFKRRREGRCVRR